MLEEGVNSYCSIAFANAYHEVQLHNSDWFEKYVQEELAAALITVTRFIDYYEYKGRPFADTQPLKFPRKEAYYNGGLIDSTSVPIQIKYACAQIALDYLRQGVGPSDSSASSTSISGSISKFKAGPVEINYAGSGATASNSTDVTFISPEGFRLLNPFLGNNYSGHRLVRV